MTEEAKPTRAQIPLAKEARIAVFREDLPAFRGVFTLHGRDDAALAALWFTAAQARNMAASFTLVAELLDAALAVAGPTSAVEKLQ